MAPQNGTENRSAIDSASQSIVTVRQIFSADPAMKDRAIFQASAVLPFFFGGCTTLPKNTSEDRASI